MPTEVRAPATVRVRFSIRKSRHGDAMNYVFAVLILLACTGASAQNVSKGRVRIDLAAAGPGVEARSAVALKCTRIASAAVYAHARGKLNGAMNEAAKVKSTGASEDAFFKSVTDMFHIDANDDALLPGLFLAKLDIMWLEERQPYKAEFEPIYTAYAAASCARVASFEPNT